MAAPAFEERFSRQVLLPHVGTAGQEKWGGSTVLLAGEGTALESALEALRRSGVSKLPLLKPGSLDATPSASMTLVLTEDAAWRRTLSRSLRAASKPVLFGWPAGSGFALFLSGAQSSQCPCFECFEVMNPKAFGKGTPSVRRMLGALAASEVLKWILDGKSPLAGKVWITSLDEGVSFHHQVRSSSKCQARMREEGAAVTP